VFAVAWAILPKAESNFSRPSLDWLPWRSYLTFGCASYATGAALMALINYAVATVLRAENQSLPSINGNDPYVLSCIFSAYFPVVTVCLSFLTDLHLRHRTSTRWGGRLRDAVVTAAALAGTNLLIRLVVWGSLGGQLPWTFFFIVAALGGFVGALVPGSAAPYLTTPTQGTPVGQPRESFARSDYESETADAPAYHVTAP